MIDEGLRWLLASASVLRGLGAGVITGLLLMIPARRRLGLVAYAQATRALYAGKGVRVYGAVTVLGVALTVVATIVAFQHGAPGSVTSATMISCVASGLGFVGTVRNLPVMRQLSATADEDEARVACLLATWERWHLVGAASHVASFVAVVVAIADM